MLHVLSLVDVLESEAYKKLSCNVNNSLQLDATLHELGMDISQGYEVSLVTHRTTISQKVVTTYRYSGYLRTDKVWKDKVISVKRKYMMGWL